MNGRDRKKKSKCGARDNKTSKSDHFSLQILYDDGERFNEG